MGVPNSTITRQAKTSGIQCPTSSFISIHRVLLFANQRRPGPHKIGPYVSDTKGQDPTFKDKLKRRVPFSFSSLLYSRSDHRTNQRDHHAAALETLSNGPTRAPLPLGPVPHHMTELCGCCCPTLLKKKKNTPPFALHGPRN